MRENRTPGSVQGAPGNRRSYCDGQENMNEADKRRLVAELSNGEIPVSAGRAKLRLNAGVVYVRYCSTNAGNPEQYKFNIN